MDFSTDHNPAGEPPSADTAPDSQEIIDIFDLGDTTAEADKLATPAVAPEATPASGEAATAPASPVTTPPAVEPTPPPATPAAPAPSTGTPPAAPAAAPAPTEPPAAAPTPTPGLVDEQALRTASLTAQVDALKRERDALLASQQSGTPTAASPGQAEPEVPAYRYALTIPKPVQDALLSEDPQQNITAINAIVNDLGTIVHNTVVTQIRAEVKESFQNLSNMAENLGQSETRGAAIENSKKEYYTLFPTHENPLVLPILQAESQKLASEFPQLKWDANYANALGARVNAAIAAISGQPAPVAEPAPAPGQAPPARPAAMLPSGQRAAPVTPSGDVGEEIMGILDPFSG